MSTEMVIGVAASTCTGISLFPQLVKILKEKKAGDISYKMLLILLAGLALWIVYGFYHRDPIIIISNMISLLINICILIVNRYYEKHNKT